MKIINKLICLIFGHKGSFYIHDYGEGTDIGYAKRYKDTWHCTRCGLGDMRGKEG